MLPGGADHVERDRADEVAGHAGGEGPLLVLETVGVGDDEDPGTHALADAVERDAGAGEQGIDVPVQHMRREHVEQVETRHVGQFRGHEPGVGPEPPRQTHRRAAVDAEVKPHLAGLCGPHEVTVVIARRVDDHELADRRGRPAGTLHDLGFTFAAIHDFKPP